MKVIAPSAAAGRTSPSNAVWSGRGACAVPAAAATGRTALVSEQDGEARKVETCSACRGYLKSVSTLRPWPGDEVALVDLATVDLDLVALERDFERPEPRPLEPGVRVIG
jgi:formate dehydrogenase maturation protein FdhE